MCSENKSLSLEVSEHFFCCYSNMIISFNVIFQLMGISVLLFSPLTFSFPSIPFLLHFAVTLINFLHLICNHLKIVFAVNIGHREIDEAYACTTEIILMFYIKYTYHFK